MRGGKVFKFSGGFFGGKGGLEEIKADLYAVGSDPDRKIDDAENI